MRKSSKFFGFKVPTKRYIKLLVAVPSGTFIGVMLMGGTAWASGTGYAPPSQATGTAPGGFSQVVLNEPVPSGGGTLSATFGSSSYSVNVPAADAAAGVDVSVTAPSNLSAANNAVLGFGIALSNNGVGVTGSFNAPITITVSNSAIHAGEVVDIWNGSAWVLYPNATVTNGSLTVTVTGDPQFALVSASTPIPGSTSPHTGIPIEGFLLLGGLSLLGGIGATSFAVRSRYRKA